MSSLKWRSIPKFGTAVCAAAVVASSCPAQTKIYVGDYKFNDPLLTVMDPGGGGAQQLPVIPPADWLVVGLHVDPVSQKIYWTHGSFNSGAIRRANFDGSDVETLRSGLTNPRGLAVDVTGGKIYWSDTQDDRMYRANLDGTAMEAIVDTGHQLGRPTLELSAGKIYFGNYGTGDIRRANLDGTDLEILFDGLFTPIAIALDTGAGKIYWADSNTSFVSNHIVRADLDGANREILYTGQGTSSGFTGIGLDLAAGKLYWSDEITAAEKGVWESALNGTDAKRIYASPNGWNAGAMTIVVGVCSADLDGDLEIGFGDLLTLLASWGPCAGCPADLDGDDVVGFGDLLQLLAAWGPC